MKQLRALLPIILLGIVAVLMILTNPLGAGQAGEGASVSINLYSDDISGDVAPTPSLPPVSDSDQVRPTPSPPAPGGEPSPTPLAFYARQLQTAVPGSSSSNAAAPDGDWNPPQIEVPIAHHPFDHYWMIRPVASNYNNYATPYYPYGSNGPANDLRIHHGIDITNPIGVEVLAAADGTVIWSGRGHRNEQEHITAYGNTIVIEHDFGYNGQPVYSLYAHLSVLLVEQNTPIKAGDVIGLIGNTGQVTGAHVHFEVRVGRNYYNSVRNPALWIAPYANTGTVAGRITLEDGSPVYDAQVVLIDSTTGRTTHRTTTYAGFGVNPDDNWAENFVIADVPVGHYRVLCRWGGTTWRTDIEVLPGATNWAEMERLSPTSALDK